MSDIDDLPGHERMALLSEIRARALSTGTPARVQGQNKSGFEVQATAGRVRLLVWSGTSHAPSGPLLDDIGEDMGFYEPVSRPHPCAESAHATLITEGLTSAPCHHDWGMWTHFDARNESGHLARCLECEARAVRALARRGQRQDWSYDTWSLRGHIWRRWIKCGPVPGSLGTQARHGQVTT